MLPVIVSQLVVLLKDTALGYIIGLPRAAASAASTSCRRNYGNVVAAAIVIAVDLHRHQLAADAAGAGWTGDAAGGVRRAAATAPARPSAAEATAPDRAAPPGLTAIGVGRRSGRAA